ncbi:MAG: 50S ribosomal protein L11 [Rickettsiaceae bacterium]|nr:50S ribosomal protein L11 [Rickettsiaceae bacterium]
MSKKKVAGKIKLILQAGKANPSPPIGPALGQRGLNIMEFCKAFNASTQSYNPGTPIPVEITAYEDKSFTFVLKTSPATYYIKQFAKITKGSAATKKDSAVAKISFEDCKEIAKIKMADLNARDIDAGARIIAGSAESMGIEVIK